LVYILEDLNINVISREYLEAKVGEQVAKLRKENQEKTLNAVEIGSAVNADSIITGSVFVEVGPLVKIASLQLIDVNTGKVLLSFVMDAQSGKTITETAKSFVESIVQ